MKDTLAERRSDMLPVRTFGFLEITDGEYMKNNGVLWKQNIHPAGLLS